jgi:alpha-D-xyloside xylohydrolase
MRGVFLAPLLCVCAFCESNQVPPAPQTFDLGDQTVATFSNGALSVTRDGAPLLSSPSGVSLMTRAIDSDSPDEWHDPAKTNAYGFSAIDPRTITIESPSPGVLHVTTPDDGSPTVLVRVSLASDDGFYTGLGEQFAHVSARGAITPMHLLIDAQFESATNDAHVPVPLLVSSKGYGVFFESHEAGAFDVASTDANTVTATFEGKVSSVWFFFARDPLEVIAEYTHYVGFPRVLPRWALGPMYWRNEFTSDDEVIDDAAMFRTLHIPTTTIWIDNPWQTSYNSFTVDTTRFADPTTLLGEMGALGYRMMFWSEPYLEKPGTGPPDEAQSLYTQAAATPGALVRLHDDTIFAAPGSDTSKQFGMIDFTTSAGRDFWANLATREVTLGASGFKLDYGEDVIAQIFNARIGIVYADGETDRTARTYPRFYHAAYHQALDALRPDGVLLVRASSYGGAQNCDIVWPGDLDPDFSKRGDPTNDSNGTFFVGGLPAAVVAAETLSASGFPSFGSDTGGFRHGAPTKEALLRWAEHTALSVVMQLGGGGDTHAPWAYDDETVTLYKNLATLHTDLEPYLSSALNDAETLGLPTIRPLPLAFPTDTASFDFADDEYMLGADLLIAPVVTQGATNHVVHFPPGAWANFATGDLTTGPVEQTVDAPLGAPMFYARVGALVPMLASDVDSLVDASAPAVVSASQRPTYEARGFPSGPANASYDDGSEISIDDTSQGVGVTFAPGTFGTAVVFTLDLRSRTGKTSPLTHVVIGTDEVPAMTSEADVRAATGSAFFLDGDSIVLRIAGGATAWIE